MLVVMSTPNAQILLPISFPIRATQALKKEKFQVPSGVGTQQGKPEKSFCARTRKLCRI